VSNLNWVDAEHVTVVVVFPGEEDPDGDFSEDFTLVINNQWDGIGLAVTAPSKEDLVSFLAKVREAVQNIPDHE
jgi:hypothetical protein